MKKSYFGLFSIAFLACCTITGGAAFANTITNQVPTDFASGTSFTVTLDAQNGGKWEGTWDNYYVGYAFSFTDPGNKNTYDEQFALCIDPTDYNSSASYSGMTFSNAVSSYKGTSPTQAQYNEAAYLLYQEELGKLSAYNTQVAAWQVLGIITDLSSTNDLAAYNAYLAALGESNFKSPSNFYVVVSPANDGLTFGPVTGTLSSQDYMFYTLPVPTPEPASLLLVIGSALAFGVTGAFKKRRGIA